MCELPVRVMFRDYDGTIREGWNVTNLIDPEQRARFNTAAAKAFGMPPPVELVDMSDLDALDSDSAPDA